MTHLMTLIQWLNLLVLKLCIEHRMVRYIGISEFSWLFFSPLNKSLHTHLWLCTLVLGAAFHGVAERSNFWQEWKVTHYWGTQLLISVSYSRALGCLYQNLSDASSGDCFACSIPQIVRSFFLHLLTVSPKLFSHCFGLLLPVISSSETMNIILSLQLYC